MKLKRVLLVDNYDSFTYNLSHLIEALDVLVDVVRNDEIQFNELEKYTHVVISPGPGLPEEAGEIMNLLNHLDSKVPMLGVCLGMQAMALHLGGQLYNQDDVKHGVEVTVHSSGGKLFNLTPSEFKVGLYHSWAVTEGQGDFVVTAFGPKEVVMGLENAERKMYGVQFHPESIMTPEGKNILKSFLD